MILQILKSLKPYFCLLLVAAAISPNLIAQSSPFDEEFLDSLDPSVREQLEGGNKEEDSKLDELFRLDTSVEKNEAILKNLRDQLDALQERMEESNKDQSSSLKRFGDQFFNSLQTTFMPINIPNLGDDYVLDVGDEFLLTLTGKLNNEYPLVLGKDGSLTIPAMGKVYLSGKTLDEAETLVDNFLNKTQIGVTGYLALSKIRDVQVLIIGGVENPGVYTISGGSNPLNAINIAGGISSKGSYRKIDHKRNGETIDQIDLYNTFIFGEYSVNSSIRSGDVIFVHPTNFHVPISGGVNFPAIFELNDGETLSTLITFAGGTSESFHGYDHVIVNRVDLDSKDLINIKTNDFSGFKLSPRDSVYVPAFDNEKMAMKSVVIEGMVHKPGEYFIQDGESLTSLISRAGGYKEGAYIYGGAIFREDTLNKQKLFAEINYRDTVNFIVSNLGQPNVSISSSSLQLLIEELKSQNFTGRVITDFNISKIEKNPKLDLLLQDKDKIIVPALQKVVYLFGDFKSPTNTRYDSSLSIKDYIKLAGGLKDSALSEIIVIDPDGNSHNYQTKLAFFGSEAEIYPGSIIYAPRNIGKINGLQYAATVSPVLSNLALALASLNSIND